MKPRTVLRVRQIADRMWAIAKTFDGDKRSTPLTFAERGALKAMVSDLHALAEGKDLKPWDESEVSDLGELTLDDLKTIGEAARAADNVKQLQELKKKN